MTKINKLFDIRTWLPYQLWHISQEAGFQLEAYYAPKFGLTGEGWRFLAMLASCAPISAKELGALLDIDQVQVTRTLNKLLDLGYVLRKTDQADRRRVILSLNKKGQQVYEAITAEAVKQENAMLAGLSSAEQTALHSAIEKLAGKPD